jgi:hypothetical protein
VLQGLRGCRAADTRCCWRDVVPALLAAATGALQAPRVALIALLLLDKCQRGGRQGARVGGVRLCGELLVPGVAGILI